MCDVLVILALVCVKSQTKRAFLTRKTVRFLSPKFVVVVFSFDKLALLKADEC